VVSWVVRPNGSQLNDMPRMMPHAAPRPAGRGAAAYGVANSVSALCSVAAGTVTVRDR
jgi:hypothetical protein